MTPEQVTRTKARSYALLGAGIAALVGAYQLATSAPRKGDTPVLVPILFAVLAVVFFIIAGLMLRKASKQNVPAAVTDLSGPQGKIVIWLTVIGFIALAGTYFVGYIAPQDEPSRLVLSGGLLLIVGFASSARGGSRAKYVVMRQR